MTTVNALLRTLPKVNGAYEVFFTVILDDNTLNEAVISEIEILYGSVSINGVYVTPKNNEQVALGVTATFNSITYFSILYFKAVYSQATPDTRERLTQKIPYGIFTDLSNLSIMGQILNSISNMLNGYYAEYFNTQNLVYATTYSAELELELNGTVGLITDSIHLDKVLGLLAALNTVYLNEYDLELFISKYIYYRLGTVSAVYIDDHVNKIDNYWILNQSLLGTSTILAPASYTPVVSNLDWTIFNSSLFTAEFEQEIKNLIIRVSRADIGNDVVFSPLVSPTLSPTPPGFTLIGATYPLDPRLIYDKCIEYVGDELFPLNIIGYRRNY